MSIAAIILLLMIWENISPRRQSNMMSPFPVQDQGVYRMLPFRSNSIVLEIPKHFKLPHRDSVYMLNWRAHQNYLVNGISSHRPQTHISDLAFVIGRLQKNFPDEVRLKLLLEKFSVTHIIFHWQSLSNYQRDPDAREKTLKKISRVRKYGRLLYNDEEKAILKVQEYIPIKRLIRTYSLFHLRDNVVKITLCQKYTGNIWIFLNNRFVRNMTVNSGTIDLDFRNRRLNSDGNRIEVRFKSPVLLQEISFVGE